MQLSSARTCWIATLAVASIACGPGPAFGQSRGKRYQRSQLQKRLAVIERPGLSIGEFSLAQKPVVDGDTIRVDGLSTSLRLLSIDTEEKFRTKEDRRLFEMGWDKYAKLKRGDSIKPVKMATPMGEEATRWAEKFFADVRVVRLERDHPKELRGRYGRYLAYVFAKKGDTWVHYNVECVRAGMSPYFTKYSYSRRFHKDFVQAQNEARAAKRGIWDRKKRAYLDYMDRELWWTARADFIAQFEANAKDRSDHIVLTHWDALRRLEDNVGKQVVLLATIGDIHLGDKGPTRVMLSRRLHADFPLIYFDKDLFGSSGVARWQGEFVRVHGVVTRYYNKYKKKHELQIVIDLPSQVAGPRLPWMKR